MEIEKKKSLVRTFIAGLVALMPIVLTLIILKWVITKIANIIGPNSGLGAALQDGVSFVTGTNHELLSYLIGLLLTIVLILGLGFFVQARLKYSLGPLVDKILKGTPIIGGIYKPVSQVVGLMANNDDPELKSMSVVSCEYAGVDCLGLLTSNKIYEVGGQPRKMVFLPQAPIPMTGNLALVPSEKIVAMPNMSVDELLQTFVSLGLITADTKQTEAPIKKL